MMNGNEIEFKNGILGSMIGILNQEQLLKLKEVIDEQLDRYWVATRCASVNTCNLDNVGYLNAYVSYLDQSGYSRGTIALYKNRNMLLFAFINVPVKEMGVNHLRDFLNYYKTVRKVCNRTLDGVRKNITSFFGWLEKEDVILKNPTRKLDHIKYEEQVLKPFNSVDLAKIRDNCKCIRDRAIVEVLYSTGLRISEFVQLNRESFVNREAVIMGKGGKERTVFITDVAMYYVKEYLKTRTDDNEALFVSLIAPHVRVTKNSIEARLKQLGCNIDLRVTPHVFRRSLCSDLLRVNVPLAKVQKIMGHAKGETTLKHYYYAENEDLKSEFSKYIRQLTLYN